MAQNFDLTQTGPELQARVDQVFPNRDAIEQETVTREAQDESLETSLKEYTDTEQARAEAAEGALDTRVSANEVDIDLLKSQYEALTQSDIIVGPLPSTGQPNKIYRVPGSTYYTDYMWANGGWVKLAEYSTLDGYVYKGIATPTGTPVQSAEAVFYFAVQPGTYTNYGGLVVTNTIAMLKYNGTEWTKDDLIGIDDKPTAGSDNLVTSGAVAASVVYDISAANAVGGQLATYADLAAALNGGTNVPVDVRKGGMEIKFVQSSDNKYVQYFLTKDEWSLSEADWQKMNLEEEVSQLGQKLDNQTYISVKFPFFGNIRANGEIVESQDYSLTDYIPVNEGDVVIYSGSVGVVAYNVVGYDASKVHNADLLGAATVENRHITIPSGVKFIRASSRNENYNPPYTPVLKIIALEEIIILSDRLKSFQKTEVPFDRVGYMNLDGLPVTIETYSRTNFIPVGEGQVVVYSGSTGTGTTAIAGYDEEQNYLQGVLGYGDYDKTKVTIPQGVSFVVCNGRTESFSPTPSILPYFEIGTKDAVKGLLDTEKQEKNIYKHKKLYVIGDSIPHGQSVSVPSGATMCYQPFPALVAKGLGMELKNYAIGGSTIAVSPLILGGSEKGFGGFVTSWDETDKDNTKYYILLSGSPSSSGVGNYSGTTYYHNGSSWVTSSISARTPISERYKTMDNNADIVLVFCGTNDFQYNWTPIGTITDNTPITFYGALNQLCAGLLEKFFGKPIIFCTPIKRCQTATTTSDTSAHNGGSYGSITSKNTFDKTLKDYGFIIEEVCSMYSIPVINTYSESMLNPQLPSQNLLFDNWKTHPTQDGHNILARLISGKLQTFIGETKL